MNQGLEMPDFRRDIYLDTDIEGGYDRNSDVQKLQNQTTWKSWTSNRLVIVGVRDILTLSLTSAFCFVDVFKDLLGRSRMYTMILCGILAIYPYNIRSIGDVLNMTVAIIVSTTISLCIFVIVAYLFPSQPAAFLLLYLVVCFSLFYYGTKYPKDRIGCALGTIFLGAFVSQGYYSLNYGKCVDNFACAFSSEAIPIYFAVMLGTAIHVLATCLIFPWTSTSCMEKHLEETRQSIIQLFLCDARAFASLLDGGSVTPAMTAKLGELRATMQKSKDKMRASAPSAKFEQQLLFTGKYKALGEVMADLKIISRYVTILTDELLQQDEKSTALLHADPEMRYCITKIVRILVELLDGDTTNKSLLGELRVNLVHMIDGYAKRITAKFDDVCTESFDSSKDPGHLRFVNLDIDTVSRIVIFAQMLNVMIPKVLEAHERRIKSAVSCRFFSSFADWRKETSMSMPSSDTFARVPLPPLLSTKRVVSYFDHIGHDEAFVLSVKYAFVSLLIMVFALLPSTAEFFQDFFLLSMINTFQSVMRQAHYGLMQQRMIERMSGILISYVLAASAFSLVGEYWDSWAIFLLGLPMLFGYIFLKEFWGKWQYLLYKVATNYYITIVVVIDQGGNVWVGGGIVAITSALGVVIGIIVGLVLWPSTGKKQLRKLISYCLGEMMLMYECASLVNYETMNANNTNSNKILELHNHLTLSENDIAHKIHVESQLLLKAAKLEPYDGYHETTCANYEKAIRALGVIFRALWKLAHLRGATSISHRFVREPLRIVKERMIPSHFCMVSAVILSGVSVPLPTILTIAGDPDSMKHFWAKYMLDVYADKSLMSSSGGKVFSTVNLLVQRRSYIDMSNAFASFGEFMEGFQYGQPMYAAHLKHHAFSTNLHSNSDNLASVEPHWDSNLIPK